MQEYKTTISKASIVAVAFILTIVFLIVCAGLFGAFGIVVRWAIGAIA